MCLTLCFQVIFKPRSPGKVHGIPMIRWIIQLFQLNVLKVRNTSNFLLDPKQNLGYTSNQSATQGQHDKSFHQNIVPPKIIPPKIIPPKIIPQKTVPPKIIPTKFVPPKSHSTKKSFHQKWSLQKMYFKNLILHRKRMISDHSCRNIQQL